MYRIVEVLGVKVILWYGTLLKDRIKSNALLAHWKDLTEMFQKHHEFLKNYFLVKLYEEEIIRT